MKKEIKLLPCPFCGVTPTILICDGEGNIHDEDGYEKERWSGLTFAIKHEIDYSKISYVCPIATHQDEILGTQLYESVKELTEMWNKRV